MILASRDIAPDRNLYLARAEELVSQSRCCVVGYGK